MNVSLVNNTIVILPTLARVKNEYFPWKRKHFRHDLIMDSYAGGIINLTCKVTGETFKTHYTAFHAEGEHMVDPDTILAYLASIIAGIPFDVPTPISDLYPQEDALSTADLNSTGSWSPRGAQLAINAGDTAAGSSFAMNLHSYAPGGQDYAELILHGLVIGQSYDLTFSSKFVPGGLPGALAGPMFWLGVASSPHIDVTGDVDYTEHTVTFSPTGNQVYVRFWVVADSHDGTGDNLLLDKFSVYDHVALPFPTP